MVGGEDCLGVASSAAAPYAALSPKEISGSGVAFFLDTFSWLSKRNRVASRATATVFTLSLALSPQGREDKKRPHPNPLCASHILRFAQDQLNAVLRPEGWSLKGRGNAFFVWLDSSLCSE